MIRPHCASATVLAWILAGTQLVQAGTLRYRTIVLVALRQIPLCVAFAILNLGVVCDHAGAQLVQAPFGPDGAWNLYELMELPRTWVDANADAQSRTRREAAGYLVSIHSPEENFFLNSFAGSGRVWIGLTDREGAAPAVDVGRLTYPQESTRLPNRLKQGWAWTSGEAFTYSNWGPSEPNNYMDAEDAVHLDSDERWDDNQGGFRENEPIIPTRQPGTSPPEDFAAGFVKMLPYIVEYPTAAQQPFVDIAIADFRILPREPLPGPPGTDGLWGVRDIRKLPRQDNLRSVLNQSWDRARKYDAQLPRLDIADPDTNSAGGPVLLGDPIPYPSNDSTGPFSDDDDILSIAHGRLAVAEPGRYTVQIRSSDGFALRFRGAQWRSAQGSGQIDPFDPETLFFNQTIDDGTTLGTLDLRGGVYDVEFVSWARDDDAFFELTSAKGDVDRSRDAQWIALGQPAVFPERVTSPIASLRGTAQVVNGESARTIEGARDEILMFARNDPNSPRANVDTLLLYDGDDICCGRPGADERDAGTAYEFPNGGPDHFTTGVFGELTVDDGDDDPNEILDVTFYLASADRAQLRIVGQDFVRAAGHPEVKLRDIDGDFSLTADFATQNTGIYGMVRLPEGEHRFQLFHLEDEGDAGLEVWVAEGNQVGSFNTFTFRPLGQPDETVLPRNVGLQLVGDSPPGDFDANGTLDVNDIQLLYEEINDWSSRDQFDLNHDTMVDALDQIVWIGEIFGSSIGDSNLDGIFDSSDLIAVLKAGQFEDGLPRNSSWATGDWNADFEFDSGDFVLAFQNGGYVSDSRIEPVPEPQVFTVWLWIAIAYSRTLLKSSTRQTRCTGTYFSLSVMGPAHSIFLAPYRRH